MALHKEAVVWLNDRQLLLTVNYDPPHHEGRVGSVTIDLPDGRREYIRVFGQFPGMSDPKDVAHFEIRLRHICEDPALIQDLFGISVTSPRARWFNPSMAMRSKGWGTAPIPARF